ncbi:diguanylate cyclase domain-containing protein [Nitratifractor sp.]
MNAVNKLWSIYKVTWLLYIGIVLMPIGTLYVYFQLTHFVDGEQVVREIAQAGGDMLERSAISEDKIRARIDSRIETALADSASWYRSHADSSYYVGSQTPWKDFRDLRSCWESLKTHADRSEALQCWREARSLAFATERMNMLLFDRIRTYLLLAIVLSVILMGLLIYVVRYYMYHQVCKSIVHAPDDGLHDREYCRLSLTQLCAQADRSERPLSTMLIRAELQENRKHFRTEELAEAIVVLEEALKEGTRLSDIVCRIGKESFFLLMPNTDEEGAEMAVARIGRMLEGKLGKAAEHVKLELRAHTRRPEEKCADFWKRSTR